MNNLTFKKGTLFYEYIVSIINNIDISIEDNLFNKFSEAIDNILNTSEFQMDYQLDENLEKMLLSIVDFELKYNLRNIDLILSKFLHLVAQENPNKTLLVFYDSSLVSLDFSFIDSYYCFDISQLKTLDDYNLICENEMLKFSLDGILEQLESIWPVDFDRRLVNVAVYNYFLQKRNINRMIARTEIELLTFTILNKKYGETSVIVNKTVNVRDNVKSFLQKF